MAGAVPTSPEPIRVIVEEDNGREALPLDWALRSGTEAPFAVILLVARCHRVATRS